jgi:iron complex outermembrane recepter protein
VWSPGVNGDGLRGENAPTRIVRDGINAPSPVTVVTADQLEDMAPGNVISGLSQFPLFCGNTSSDSPGNFFVTPGSGNLNLRGIGTNRTLVLLNGMHVDDDGTTR